MKMIMFLANYILLLNLHYFTLIFVATNLYAPFLCQYPRSHGKLGVYGD